MAQDNDGMAKGLIIGFIAGSVVGAVLALLYAPKAGRELRADIKQKTGEFVDDAQEYLERAKKRATEIINEGKQQSQILIEGARKRAETLLDDAERILSDARARGSSEEPRS